MKKIYVTKGQILQRKGESHTKIFHVESGLLRSYTIDDKGKEHIFMFAPEDWIIADSKSFGEPCQLFIDAIEDSVVFVEKREEHIIADFQKIVNRLGVLQERILMLLSASAIERYEDFINTYPTIVQRVPQKMIASYLGVTPEALSYAKKKRKK